ncbi:MAG TPA: DUF2339 domain-containing protein [Gammaproteobacteria bacterium]|nr:DUF2339 domain-containing protein [Gammaproteobacteria bacterium]
MLGVVLALIGGVMGYGLLGWSTGGFVAGAAIGALAGWASDLRDRLVKIEKRLAGLEQRDSWPEQVHGDTTAAAQDARAAGAQRPEEDLAAAARSMAEAADARTAAEPATAGAASGDAAQPGRAAAQHDAAAADTDRAAAAAAERGRRRARQAAREPELGSLDIFLQRVKRWFTTGNVPVKVGVVLSVFGVGFLIKAGVERGWLVLPIEYRLILVALFGIALLAIGWRLRSRERTYALSMQGGGIAVLYLTIYASFALYKLLPGTAAFGLLFVVTVAAGTLAVLQNAKALAVLGIVGGFMAPVLTSDGGGNHVALFSYYAVLDVAVLGIAWFKSWRALNVLGFVFTFGIATLWGYDGYRPELFASTEPFLVLFVAMYMVIPVLFAMDRNRARIGLRSTAADGGSAAEAADAVPTQPNLKGFVDGTLVFGTPLVGFGLQSQLVANMEYGLAISALVLAAAYVCLATFIYRRGAPELRVLVEAQLAMGVVFLAVAVPLALDARWTSAAWAVQGAALVWLGFRQSRRLPLAMGLALQLLAGAAYAKQPWLGSDLPWINGYLLGALLIAFAGGFASRCTDRARGEFAERWPRARSIVAALLLAWAAGWWLFAGFAEIARQLPYQQTLAASLLFAAATTLLAMNGARWLQWPRLDAVALLSWPIAALGLAYDSIAEPHPAVSYGWLAWPALLAAQLVFLRGRQQRFPRLRGVLHAIAYWLAAILVAREIYWQVDRVTDADTWPLAAALAVTAAWVLATLRLRARVAWPLAAHARLYATACAGAVLAALVLATLSANLASPGDALPLPYVPVLNPLEIVSVFVLLLLVHWLALEEREHGPVALAAPQRAAVAGVLGWFLLTMSVARAVHHYAGVPFDLESLARSTTLQAALSIVWGATALTAMTFGARRMRRAVWLTGAALMTVVVAKLFLVDLGNAGTLGRVVSFLGVGVLLLIVGYFAPVPPRAELDRSAA